MAQLVARLLWEQEAGSSSLPTPTMSSDAQSSRQPRPSLEDLAQARYVSFTTFRRNGSPVATPVWIVPFDGGFAFTTEMNSGKVKRLRHDARCTVRVCDMRGRVADGATIFDGAAVVLDQTRTEQVTDLIKSKYRIGWMMLSVVETLRSLRRSRRETVDCAIKVTLDAD